jgi:hypothetical protein
MNVLLCNHVLIPRQRYGLLSVHKFQCPCLWKPCFVISWFPGINLFVATCMPIRFLETAHMSQYVILQFNLHLHYSQQQVNTATFKFWDTRIPSCMTGIGEHNVRPYQLFTVPSLLRRAGGRSILFTVVYSIRKGAVFYLPFLLR